MKPSSAKVALIYIAFGLLWIVGTDFISARIFSEANALSSAQTAKGLTFIFMTGLVLYVLLNRYSRELEAHDLEKSRIFGTTVSAAQHLLNNFLNNMLHFKMTAEESRALSPEVVREYEKVIDETSKKLSALGEITDATPEKIEAWVSEANKSLK